MLTLLVLAQLTIPEMKGMATTIPPSPPPGEINVPVHLSIRGHILSAMGFSTSPGVELPEGFVPVPRPGMGAGAAVEIARVCNATPIPTKEVLLDREWHQGLFVSFRDTRRESRTDLSCTRALLSTTDAFGREGFQMLEGTSWSRGAITSALYALEQHPEDQRAADVLALVTLLARRPRNLDKTAHALGDAVRLGVRSAPALRGCSEVAYRTGDTMTVRACANAALAAGLDSSWHLLRLGRLHFDASDPLRGQEYFLAAVATARDSLERAEINWQLQWFLTPQERRQWARVSPDSGVKRVRDWLMKRDTKDGQTSGARIAEHFRRLRYVERHFALDFQSFQEQKMLGGAIRNAKGKVLFQNARPYYRWQVEFDDRGIVWMRYGEPSELQDFGSTQTWIYRLSGKVLNLSFAPDEFVDATIPSRLVGSLSTIRLATQTDDNSIRPPHSIGFAAQFYRIWDPVTELPTALLGYSLLLPDLPTADSNRRQVGVDLRLQQWDEELDFRRDTTVRRVLRLPIGSTGNSLFMGALAFRTTMGTRVWSLAAQTDSATWGHDSEDDKSPIASGAFKMSDIVLGAASQGITWVKGAEHIVLAPVGQLDHTKAVSLYFQTMTRAEQQDVTTTIAIYAVAGAQPSVTLRGIAAPSAAARLKVAFQWDVALGLSSFARELDVSRLTPGLYRLEVTLHTKAGEMLGKRSTQMRLR